ncbi:unnamed protein product [Phaeothamnion confervicola]
MWQRSATTVRAALAAVPLAAVGATAARQAEAFEGSKSLAQLSFGAGPVEKRVGSQIALPSTQATLPPPADLLVASASPAPHESAPPKQQDRFASATAATPPAEGAAGDTTDAGTAADGMEDPYSFKDDDNPEEWPDTKCIICRINRGGPCKMLWRKFERCMDLAAERKDDKEVKCEQYFDAHARCASQNLEDYYLHAYSRFADEDEKSEEEPAAAAPSAMGAPAVFSAAPPAETPAPAAAKSGEEGIVASSDGAAPKHRDSAVPPASDGGGGGGGRRGGSGGRGGWFGSGGRGGGTGRGGGGRGGSGLGTARNAPPEAAAP